MHQIASCVLTEPCCPDLVSYCPTMDLVATVTAKGGVDVWRLNGQRVFGASFGGQDEDGDEENDDEQLGNGNAKGGNGRETVVRQVGWRRDGECFLHPCFRRLRRRSS